MQRLDYNAQARASMERNLAALRHTARPLEQRDGEQDALRFRLRATDPEREHIQEPKREDVNRWHWTAIALWLGYAAVILTPLVIWFLQQSPEKQASVIQGACALGLVIAAAGAWVEIMTMVERGKLK